MADVRPQKSPQKKLKKREKPTAMQSLTAYRRAVQVGTGIGIYLLVAAWGVSLWWIVGIGSLAGVVLGKFFCRWMCPMGAVMETITGSENQGGMYQYFKIGCPIAWAGGLLNRVSLLRVNRTRDACATCGKCDEACYIAKFEPQYSLYKPDAPNPSTHFACSRCLKCVDACPLKTLDVAPSWNN